MSRVISFAIHAENPEHAIAFHSAGFGGLAYCKDPEGILFGLMQADPAAD